MSDTSSVLNPMTRSPQAIPWFRQSTLLPRHDRWAPFPLTNLSLGLHTATGAYTAISNPNSIVFTGLRWTISGKTNYFRGTADTSGVIGTPAATVNLSASGLAVTCTGTNTSGQVGLICYALTPAGANTMTNKPQLTNIQEPSIYMLFTNDGSASCNINGPKAIPLNGTTPTKIIDVKPSDPMASAPVPLGVTLCSTGNGSQQPETYDMAVTASIVSY